MTRSRWSSRQCGECGFVPAGLAPGDASVAVRSFPRRWRELLAPDGFLDDDAISYRRSPEEWSALDYAAHLADALRIATDRLARVRTAERPLLAEVPGQPSAPVEDDSSVEMVLARLGDNCARVAAEIDKTGPDDWQRVGMRRRQEVSALQLAREAVHEGAHHLRDAERVLSAARRALGRPEPPFDEG